MRCARFPLWLAPCAVDDEAGRRSTDAPVGGGSQPNDRGDDETTTTEPDEPDRPDGHAEDAAPCHARRVSADGTWQNTLVLGLERSLDFATIAVSADPSCSDCAGALALAHLRLAHNNEALNAAAAASNLYAIDGSGLRPSYFAVTSMAQWQLDRREEARATLAQLRELMNDPSWASDADAKALTREAEALIEGAGSDK